MNTNYLSACMSHVVIATDELIQLGLNLSLKCKSIIIVLVVTLNAWKVLVLQKCSLVPKGVEYKKAGWSIRDLCPSYNT